MSSQSPVIGWTLRQLHHLISHSHINIYIFVQFLFCQAVWNEGDGIIWSSYILPLLCADYYSPQGTHHAKVIKCSLSPTTWTVLLEELCAGCYRISSLNHNQIPDQDKHSRLPRAVASYWMLTNPSRLIFNRFALITSVINISHQHHELKQFYYTFIIFYESMSPESSLRNICIIIFVIFYIEKNNPWCFFKYLIMMGNIIICIICWYIYNSNCSTVYLICVSWILFPVKWKERKFPSLLVSWKLFLSYCFPLWGSPCVQILMA